MTKKLKVSVRINPFNYDLVQAIADTAFYDEEKGKGNFSAALDFCLTLLRLNTKFSKYLQLVEYKAKYDRGDRSKEVLEGIREFAKIINIVMDLTES